ncbi:hypothetical protein [Acidovorax sp. sic0104]|uniref:hypothetical protein n=1 Tax=Acidovorax sp. sic0104 TaxID=2854784 RepID=UPI001C46E031|nr:hypothetical protein [Acidovorax sp. sic0104]MBV7542624.1 hypothetical protein [Acidovorax sp. sic0104]
MNDALVIGTQDISHKDGMVLRALVRLLDGGINIHARFSERIEECNVVFVPGNWPYRLRAPCITVRVKDPAQPDESPGSDCDLSVATPLRMTNVIAVLQSATQRVHGVSQFDPVRGQQALFDLLGERTRTAERRRAVVPMSSGQQIVFDFVKQLVHTAMPMEVLLSGAYTLGTPHRVSPVEEELIRSVPSHSLRHLLWELALRLAQAGAATPSRAGSYRLLRWPDAVGLAAPGHPRLAALWTSRALSLEQIRAVSGVPDASAGWFLEACLALGLAVDESTRTGDDLGTGDHRMQVATTAPASPQPPAAAAPPGWLSHLRERLKLW